MIANRTILNDLLFSCTFGIMGSPESVSVTLSQPQKDHNVF